MGRNCRWWLGLAPSIALFVIAEKAIAQIVPDTTLGAENSTINVTNPLTDYIGGGATRGANHFHSFQEFNVNEGRSAYFSNPNGIENIFSRVTGNNASQIFGKLGVLGNANLFLLNPNGIIFGQNATLDINGSFVATTASSINFADNTVFSATNPQAPPLLTISVPLGLQYGDVGADIVSAGNLAVGQNLTLEAENLTLSGTLHAGENLNLQAQDTVRVRDSASNQFVATAGTNLVVQGNQAVDIFALNHPASGLYSGGDMVLRSHNTIAGDAHYFSGGNFRIEQLDGSLGNLFSPTIRLFGLWEM